MKMVLSRLGYVVTCVVTGQESVMALTHSQLRAGAHRPAAARPARPYLGAAPAACAAADRVDADHPFRRCLGPRPDPRGLPRGSARGLSAQADLDRASWSPRSAITSTARSGEPGAPPPMLATRSPLDFERLELVHRRRRAARAGADVALPVDGRHLSRADARGLAGGDGWARAAHALKGASANIGATEVARIAEDAEGTPRPRPSD